jgi:hypothetical protein
MVMGPETKNNCAGEGQQQIAALLCRLAFLSVTTNNSAA